MNEWGPVGLCINDILVKQKFCHRSEITVASVDEWGPVGRVSTIFLSSKNSQSSTFVSTALVFKMKMSCAVSHVPGPPVLRRQSRARFPSRYC